MTSEQSHQLFLVDEANKKSCTGQYISERINSMALIHDVMSTGQYTGCSIFRETAIGYSKNYSKKVDYNPRNILTMPKDPKHISEIKDQRLRNKQKYSKYSPGNVSLHVLGTGAKGAPRSLYVFTDQTRYLFNCGEGTQRLAHELRLKLAKLEHIFVTYPVWQNIGGLPGITLTMQDVGVPNVNIHGPSGMEEMFDAAKKFVVLKNLKLSFAESNPKEIYEDNILKVQYVPLTRHLENLPDEYPEDERRQNINVNSQIGVNVDIMVDEGTTTTRHKRTRSISSYLSDSSGSNSSGKSRKRRKRKKNRSRSLSLDSSSNSSPIRPSIFSNDFCITKDKGIAMSYICQLHPRPGRLCLNKCVEMGVPPGPLLGKLKSGEDVMLENGTIVTSVQVCEPDDPGPIFIVVDCPTEEYITSMVSNKDFKKYQQFATDDSMAAYVVVHFSPKRVVEDPRYQSWMELFLPSTQHIILNETNSCMGSMAVHRIQHKLNMIHPDIFPLLKECRTELTDQKQLRVDESMKNGVEHHSSNEPCVNTLFTIHLRPRTGLDKSDEVKVNPEEYIQETLNIEGFSMALHDLKRKLQSQEGDVEPQEYPKILFLGTGSCIPNKTRNTSGILLETSDDQKILLDCGEGTYGQLVRFYGKQKSDEILANLNIVYVSHMHADHHIGLIGILQGRRRALWNLNQKHKPVILLAPIQLYIWLSFYNKYFEHIKNEFEFISNADLLHTGHRLSNISYNKIIGSLNMKEVNTCFVKHCPNAFGVALTFSNNSKITYSGDTMPCSELVTIGRDSDLLIHEATMEDDLEKEASIKLHSTTTQAIEIGRQMRAKYVLLTHFSQRYAKLPRFNESFAENVGISFDNMQVRFDDLRLLPLFNPVLMLMFAEHYDELEHKAMKRQIRQEKELIFNNGKQKIQRIQ